jgi:hypothetical protein
MREAMMRGEIDLDPLDEELAAQLGALRWHRDSKGRIVIESKDEMRKRGLPSPDRADAMSMTFAQSNWRPSRELTPEGELEQVVRRVNEAIERRNSPENRIREASGLTVDFTDEDLMEMRM